jgi:hypothetical protein
LNIAADIGAKYSVSQPYCDFFVGRSRSGARYGEREYDGYAFSSHCRSPFMRQARGWCLA